MHRSSQSIASLAAALAKAQAELVNPEKSLVATIASGPRGGPEQSFRYAPLSSGLDIVRKTLGQHEIATVQTTAIDQTAGLVNLTTVLAHSSGEWIASDWPVCAITDTATPHRMGAALTYARRYALFTLVGIAGEDDLDAPDLTKPRQQPSQPHAPKRDGNGRLKGGHSRLALPLDGRWGSKPQLPIEPMLGPEASAELRDRLVTELGGLGSGGDDAALWAKRRLGEKNRLTAQTPGASKRPSRTSWRAVDALRTRRWRPISLRPTSSFHRPQGASNRPGRRGRHGGSRRDRKLGGRRGGNVQSRGHQAINSGPKGSIRAPWPCRSRAGLGTGNTSDR